MCGKEQGELVTLAAIAPNLPENIKG